MPHKFLLICVLNYASIDISYRTQFYKWYKQLNWHRTSYKQFNELPVSNYIVAGVSSKYAKRNLQYCM